MSQYLKVALIGNPNTGKSSLFNALTGLKQKTGNFPGVTVEHTKGYFTTPNKEKIELIDLPGTYSLFPKSADEAIPYEVLSNPHHPLYPNLIIFIADAANLSRNLVLLTQVIDLGFPVILALNMIDQAKAKGVIINQKKLKTFFGVESVAMNARKKEGVAELMALIDSHPLPSEKKFIAKGKEAPVPVEGLRKALYQCNHYQAFLSLCRYNFVAPKEERIIEALDNFRKEHSFDVGKWQREDILYRHKIIKEITPELISEPRQTSYKKIQERLDTILTHRIWGYIIFLAVLFIIFQAIFSWSEYPMDLIEQSVALMQGFTQQKLSEGLLSDLLVNGIIPGIGGVIVFIPQIAFLFFFISILEDTGYLARVAFMFDKMMRGLGLNGKSIIPLISGTACAVPAIMATRNIENKKSRLITILVTPLMSCSARLPVYVLLIGLIMPEEKLFGFISYHGLALFGMYLVGFLGVVFISLILKRLVSFKEKQYFILELPVYRTPNWRNVVQAVVNQSKTFVVDAGKIIIAISIVLWFLCSYSMPDRFSKIEKKHETLAKNYPDSADKIIRSEKLESSFAGMFGKTIEPVIAPLGFDWKIGISLITSFAAREVFVGTMATLYGIEEEGKSLTSSMQSAVNSKTGKNVYGLATVISLMLFYAFAMQCMSTLAITYRETKSIKWTMVQLTSMTLLAYFASLIAYQLLR